MRAFIFNGPEAFKEGLFVNLEKLHEEGLCAYERGQQPYQGREEKGEREEEGGGRGRGRSKGEMK